MSRDDDRLSALRAGDVLHLDDDAIQVVATSDRGEACSLLMTMRDHMFHVVERPAIEAGDEEDADVAQIEQIRVGARPRLDRRYRIECLSCEAIIHDATPAPISTAHDHLTRLEIHLGGGRESSTAARRW